RPTRRHRTGRPLRSSRPSAPFSAARPATIDRLRRPAHRGTGPLGLAPGGVCRATPVTRGAGGLLPHRFTLTGRTSGGLFSVALSRGSPRVAVSNHPALWSPDVPRRSGAQRTHRRGRPADSSVVQVILRPATPDHSQNGPVTWSFGRFVGLLGTPRRRVIVWGDCDRHRASDLAAAS